LHVHKNNLKIEVRKQTLEKDREKRFKQYPASYGYGKTPLWWTYISKGSELEYVMAVIKESYEAAPDH